jgi:hypothetical protein
MTGDPQKEQPQEQQPEEKKKEEAGSCPSGGAEKPCG